MRRGVLRTLVVCVGLAASPVFAQRPRIPQEEGVVGLGLALRHLPVIGTVLYVTAHPDDEDNGVLVALQRGLGLRTVLLTATRGEGGQNEIGPELFDALGILRTEELMSAHRYDAAEQYFANAFEFGYSFSVEETLEKWGKEPTLGDVVRTVRRVRPDVILTLPLTARGGGQHHQAAARLAVEAFRAAADPARFPEQIDAGLRPWQARKIYTAGVGRADPGPAPGTPVLVSEYDPLLGVSWDELGVPAREMHRSQGMVAARPSGRRAEYTLVDAQPRIEGSESALTDGIDVSIGRLPEFAAGEEVSFLRAGIEAIVARVEEARAAYHPHVPHETLGPLRAGLTLVRQLRQDVAESSLTEGARLEIDERLEAKEEDFARAIALAHGLSLDATVDDGDAVPGQAVTLKVRTWNRGMEPIEVGDVSVQAPPGWTSERVSGGAASLAHNQSAAASFTVTVSPHPRLTRPYWTRVLGSDRLRILSPADEGLPWSPPALQARVTWTSGGVPLTTALPAVWRYAGPRGEKQKVLNVVPKLSVRLTPGVAMLPAASRRPRELRVTVTSHSRRPVAATCRLSAPRGWTVRPAVATLGFQNEDEVRTARFFVSPPAGARSGMTAVVSAVVSDGDDEFIEGHQTIAYDHVEDRRLYRPATARLRTLDVRVPPRLVVGYVPGAGDDVPAAIEQLGARVVLLSPDDLAFGNLSRFATIVTGIRAYQTRPDLRAHHDRLMRYVRAGGHLVVQYNKFEFNRGAPGAPAGDSDAVSPFAPYPAVVTSNRVTVEEAPVRRLRPLHPLLRRPNRIGDADFDGWVQERGLYFFGAKDDRYVELLASEDPWPENAGEKKGLLVDAKVGKGTWTYVGIGLWRQLPAGVPGAYRILANLISRPRGQ